jgi:hypothetical protein
MKRVISEDSSEDFLFPRDVNPTGMIVVRYRVDSRHIFLLERASNYGGSRWCWRWLNSNGLSSVNTPHYGSATRAVESVLRDSKVLCFDTTEELITWLAKTLT